MGNNSGHGAGSRVRLEAQVTGRVQGVGFRYWAADQAGGLQLSGSAVNLPDGSVSIIAEGDRTSVDRLLERLKSGKTPGRVTDVRASLSEATGEFSGFETG